MKDVLFAVAVVPSIVVFYYSWKLYTAFFSKWDMYRTSGFKVFIGRLILSTALGYMTFAFVGEKLGLRPAETPRIQAQTESKSITTYPAAEFKNSQQPAQPSSNYKFESSREITERNEAIAMPKKSQYTEQEINELEDKAQYHGTDPVIRSRLGLPPKE
jgi:hypothetical protein